MSPKKGKQRKNRKIPHFQKLLIHKRFVDLNLRFQMNIHKVTILIDKYVLD